MQKMQSRSVFPLLPLNVLQEVLGNLGVKVSISELAKPDPDKVASLLETFLQLLCTQSNACNLKISQEAIQILDYPDMYSDTLRLFKLLSVVKKMMTKVGVKDFGLKDLVQPEARRFQLQLSALINYKKFYDEKVAKFQDFQQQIDTLTNQRNSLQDESCRLTSELKQYQLRKKQEEPEVQRVLAEAKELAKKNKAVQAEIEKLGSETNNAKGQLAQKRNEATNLKLELQSAEQTKQHLKDQLVDSPEQLENSLREVKSATEMERQAVIAIEQNLRYNQTLGDVVNKLCGDMEGLNPVIDQVKQEINEKKEVSREFKAAQTKMSELEAVMKNAELQFSHWQKQIELAQDRFNRYESQRREKQESYEKALLDAKQQKENLQNEIVKEQQRIKKKMSEIESAKEQKQQLQIAHDQAIQALNNQRMKTCQLISQGMEQINFAIKQRVQNSDLNSVKEQQENDQNY
eukprot:TRINITY_DN2799_c0_g1_i8.p2 TRINITY_DN2799_c0_g1~~TRINITY_DN2799_c0_g1_i8.p2  ORF type:complete len:462 (+),score=60.14 TRINITY_DN2799_c0_g1_i8:44-1429(+)